MALAADSRSRTAFEPGHVSFSCPAMNAPSFSPSSLAANKPCAVSCRYVMHHPGSAIAVTAGLVHIQIVSHTCSGLPLLENLCCVATQWLFTVNRAASFGSGWRRAFLGFLPPFPKARARTFTAGTSLSVASKGCELPCAPPSSISCMIRAPAALLPFASCGADRRATAPLLRPVRHRNPPNR